MMKTKILMIFLAGFALLCDSCVTFGNGEVAVREQTYGRFSGVILATEWYTGCCGTNGRTP